MRVLGKTMLVKPRRFLFTLSLALLALTLAIWLFGLWKDNWFVFVRSGRVIAVSSAGGKLEFQSVSVGQIDVVELYPGFPVARDPKSPEGTRINRFARVGREDVTWIAFWHVSTTGLLRDAGMFLAARDFRSITFAYERISLPVSPAIQGLFVSAPFLGSFSRITMLRVGKSTFREFELRLYLWIPALLFSLYPASVLILAPLRKRHRIRNRLCLTCGYCLIGNTSGMCPECGAGA